MKDWNGQTGMKQKSNSEALWYNIPEWRPKLYCCKSLAAGIKHTEHFQSGLIHTYKDRFSSKWNTTAIFCIKEETISNNTSINSDNTQITVANIQTWRDLSWTACFLVIQLHAAMAHAKNSKSTKIFIKDCKSKSNFHDYNFNLINKSHVLYVCLFLGLEFFHVSFIWLWKHNIY
jgi:hypothetical protein